MSEIDTVDCRRLNLAAVPAGHRVRICCVHAGEELALRLRELGVLEGRILRIIAGGDPLICQVGDCRLGLCHRLARCVLVEPTTEGEAPDESRARRRRRWRRRGR